MSRIIAAVVVSLIAGFAAGGWLMGDESRRDGDDFEMVAVTDERLLSLEQLIAEEREARLDLEDQLQVLAEKIDRIDSDGPRAFSGEVAPVEEAQAERRPDRRVSRDFASMIRNFQGRRLTGLIDGGFSEDEARRIMKRESEAQYKAMQAAHDAQRNGEVIDPSSAMSGPQALLRAELGDSDYERYLLALGQPTAIQVTQVLEGSPGSQAGLHTGDQIVSYNGERVFNVNDLRELTLQGDVGEDVVIEIEREGVRMQLSVPRGPVGISGSGASIRNMNWWGGG
jgi:hypothetical protein